MCHHPPTFHLLAVLGRQLLEPLSVDCDVASQTVAFVLSVVFLVFAVLTVERLLEPAWQRALAVALIAFWPYSVINAARVNNDVAFYAVASPVLYLLVRFSEDARPRWLWLACALAAFGLFVKASSLALISLVVAAVAVAIVRAPNRRALGRSAAPALVALIAFTTVHGLARGGRAEPMVQRVLGTSYKPDAAEATPRTLRTYLTFDPRAIVSPPYVVTSHLRSQEPSYWNHLVKSSLFGTRNPPPARLLRHLRPRKEPLVEPSESLATAMNALLLALLAALLASVALSGRPDRTRLVCLAALAAMVAASLGFHLLVPVGNHADFRFVYPVVVPASVLYVSAVAAARARSAALTLFGHAIAVAFVLMSIAYFLSAKLA
jgi:hypothetical protein